VTFFDEVGLRAAERLEASVGPWVALASYRRLLAADPPVRGRAAIGAVRCATALGDETAIVEALPAFAAAKDEKAGALELVRALLVSKRATTARRLAEAELERRPRARAHYAVALAADAESDGDPRGWDTAEREAHALGDAAVATRAGAFYVARVFAASTRGTALDRARLVEIGERADPKLVAPDLRVLVARARLASPRKFQRAAALSLLEELVRIGNPTTRRAALVAVAAHADALAFRLERVEIDRIDAALAKSDDAALRDRASKLFAALDRARSATDAGAGAPSQWPESATAERLDAAAKTVGVDAPLAPSAWVGVRRALASGDASVRAAAARLAGAALERSLGVPPFSMVDLAREMAGEPAALAFAREAARWGEAGSAAYLGQAHRADAYAALARGDRAGGLAALLRAREAFAPAPRQPA
jgi:hypothetical protein